MSELPERIALEVATPTGLKLSVNAGSVQAPSIEGEIGVLPGHLPLIAALKSGLLKYTVKDEKKVAAIGPGFVEVDRTEVLLLTELFKEADEIDEPALRDELSSLVTEQQQLKSSMDSSEYVSLQRKIDWIQAQIQAANS